MKIEMHYPAKGDLPELSGEMRAERHCVLAYTKSLGWTQAIRRRVGKKKFEWVCSDYGGNTLFSDDEIMAWTELPEQTKENKMDSAEWTDNDVKMAIQVPSTEQICNKECAEVWRELSKAKELIDELKAIVDFQTSSNMDRHFQLKKDKEQLAKARELILKLYNAGRDVLMCRTEEKAYDNLSEAINDRSIEQFLEEVKK